MYWYILEGSQCLYVYNNTRKSVTFVNSSCKAVYSFALKGIYFKTHTHIYNWPLQPFNQDYGLASYTTHIVCINFTCEWRDLQFNVDSERQIFEETFPGQVYCLSQDFWQKSRPRNIFFFFKFLFVAWPETRIQVLSLNKPAHYLLDHGDFFSFF